MSSGCATPSPLPDSPEGTTAAVVVTAVLIGILIASLATIVGLLAWKEWAWVLAIISSGVILAIDLGWWWSGEAALPLDAAQRHRGLLPEPA